MKTERIVTSPGGDRVTIVDDADFAAAVAGAPGVRNAAQLYAKAEGRDGAIAALWFEGPIEDRKSGRCSMILTKRAERYGVTPRKSPITIMPSTALGCCIERETNGKRTYAMRLVALPERWYRRLSEQTGPATTEVVPARAAEVPPGEPATNTPDVEAGSASEPVSSDVAESVPDESLAASAAVQDVVRDGPAPIELELSASVATALLAQVVSIITAGTDTSAPMLKQLQLDVEGLQERLGVQVAYVDKLRRQLRETGEELAAVKHERDGLRRQLRSTQHNLSVATGADAQRIIDAEVRKALDKLMREAPKAHVNGEGRE